VPIRATQLPFHALAMTRFAMHSLRVLLFAAATVPASGQTPTRAALHKGALVITNVSVVPMTSERVTPDAAVIVRDGRIAWIGPRRELKAPTGARVIDGRGGYLMPGLADMHTHLFSDGEEVADSAGPSELAVMVRTAWRGPSGSVGLAHCAFADRVMRVAARLQTATSARRA